MSKQPFTLAIWLLILSIGACTPSESSIQTAIALTEAAIPATSPATSTPVNPTGCPSNESPILWSDANFRQDDKTICIYGKIHKIYDDTNGQKIIAFSDEPKRFFIIINDPLKPFIFEGDCIIAYGRVNTNINGTPYFLLSGDSIYSCPK